MTKRINLALQGGGAHGAYTWGVLDRILEDEEVEIAAISGTSAGALNGAALKCGWQAGGREGARERLAWLWNEVTQVKTLGLPDWMNAWLPHPGITSLALEYSPGYAIGDTANRVISPYAWGPYYRNPLAPVVDQLDFGGVCGAGGPRLFVGATSVRDGKIRVFTGEAITREAILASACLPTLFQAVEVTCPISGKPEYCWDGGYSGNPALFPLYAKDLPDDVVIVNINPLIRETLPTTAPEIHNRINEISFNSALLKELRAVEFVQRLLADGSVLPGRMKNVLVHMIADDDLMTDLSVATKMVPVPTLIGQLRDAGRAAADRFLSEHRDDLGHRQTADLVAMFN
ncbi:patatin-like phospholipase family protein [Roseivivax sp. GX 12232]|uniref:patatin-like phospholipase family protein n=1 Tax=Roseivivax sp. GX 12232 TaxID=2900547 RepID=UPI001E5A4DE1|nr:patatin-like phospholipase family protein [Roseivivax sp. GX 12232]MCE0504747.1 patatin-like phospholipase family protein [Roseivivax sp. GX 12232]